MDIQRQRKNFHSPRPPDVPGLLPRPGNDWSAAGRCQTILFWNPRYYKDPKEGSPNSTASHSLQGWCRTSGREGKYIALLDWRERPVRPDPTPQTGNRVHQSTG